MLGKQWPWLNNIITTIKETWFDLFGFDLLYLSYICIFLLELSSHATYFSFLVILNIVLFQKTNQTLNWLFNRSTVHLDGNDTISVYTLHPHYIVPSSSSTPLHCLLPIISSTWSFPWSISSFRRLPSRWLLSLNRDHSVFRYWSCLSRYNVSISSSVRPWDSIRKKWTMSAIRKQQLAKTYPYR